MSEEETRGHGMVGVISADQSRWPAFTMSLLRLRPPRGSDWDWVRGGKIAINRNLLVKHMLEDERRFEWMWFIDDDHTFDRNILQQMLEKNVPISQPVVSTRKPPYLPYGYMRQEDGCYYTLDWPSLPESGLLRVDAVGCGGMMVRREVFEAVGYPWFESGKTGPDQLGEDLWFCEKARRLGFDSYVDCDARMGHISSYEVWPLQDQGKWCLNLEVEHGLAIRIPFDFCRDKVQSEA